MTESEQIKVSLKKSRKIKDLKKMIFDPEVKLDPNRGLRCSYEALRPSCPGCKGFGIVSDTQGAFIQSKVCPDCVGTCVMCYGSCAHDVESVGEDGKKTKRSVLCANPPLSRVVSILNDAHLPARYAKASLKDFTNTTGNYQQVIAHIERWLAEFKMERDQPGLLLQGNVGIGKTYLLICIAKRLAVKGVKVKFVDFFQLLLDIKTKFEGNLTNIGANSYIKALIDAPVLIIDELGKGRLSDFETMVLDQIVMGRYNSGKPIIGSTNYRLNRSQSATHYKKDARTGNYVAWNKSQNLDETPPDRVHLESAFQKTTDFLEERVGARIYSRLVEGSVCIEWGEARNIRYNMMQTKKHIFQND